MNNTTHTTNLSSFTKLGNSAHGVSTRTFAGYLGTLSIQLAFPREGKPPAPTHENAPMASYTHEQTAHTTNLSPVTCLNNNALGLSLGHLLDS